jgi:uncharacterized membrane protein YeiH
MKSELRPRVSHLLLGLDLMGTALFAAEGASAAVQARLDVLGMMVLGFVTALGGGIVRDLLIGDVPPSSIRNWIYPATALAAAGAVFFLHVYTSAINPWVVTTLDAAGLSLFAVSGATKAIEFRLHPLLATMMGAITGVGGGTIRDMLLGQVPKVLRSDVYAAAALLGAAITIVCLTLKLRPVLASSLGLAACFLLRMMAVYYHWNLPRATA